MVKFSLKYLSLTMVIPQPLELLGLISDLQLLKILGFSV